MWSVNDGAEVHLQKTLWAFGKNTKSVVFPVGWANKDLGYSHLSNNRGGWNKRGGSAKVAK